MKFLDAATKCISERCLSVAILTCDGTELATIGCGLVQIVVYLHAKKCP